MKKSIRHILKILVILLFIGLEYSSNSQDPPPPPGGNAGGGGGAGGADGSRNGAPIGGGLFILLGMAGIYGGYKGYKIWREKKAEEEEKM